MKLVQGNHKLIYGTACCIFNINLSMFYFIFNLRLSKLDLPNYKQEKEESVV